MVKISPIPEGYVDCRHVPEVCEAVLSAELVEHSRKRQNSQTKKAIKGSSDIRDKVR
jgi:hypothetical protein